MKIYDNIGGLIGNTPLLRVNNIIKSEKLSADLLVKPELFNPTGSSKDRAALYMINDALGKGVIKDGATIIEPTSGNTGIGLASICASLGFKTILTMPDTMSVERIRFLKAYGAEVVLTEGKKGMKGAIEKALEIKEKTPNSFIPSQFDNPSNINAHYMTTAREIWQDTDGKVDIFVAGIGTGGTLSGTAKYLKEKKSDVKIVGVEPFDSPLISKGKFGPHKLQGIGANFIPKNFLSNLCDDVFAVTTENAYDYARMLAKKEGLLTGISSGAALFVGVELAKRKENYGKTIVVLLPDSGDRYLSEEVYR